MKRTAVARTFVPAAPALVFDVFTHYETYRALAGVRGTTLVTPGRPEAANGLGAVRELDLGVMKLREQVTCVQRPDFWDYRFVDWPLPFVHRGGRMAFEAVPGGTRMVWSSTVEAEGLRGLALPAIMWLSGAGLKLLSLQMKRIVMRRAAELAAGR